MARASWWSSPTTPHLSASLRLSTTPCWPRPESTTMLETTMCLEQLVESTSEFVLSPSPTPETLTSSEPCLVLRKLVNKLQQHLILYNVYSVIILLFLYLGIDHN